MLDRSSERKAVGIDSTLEPRPFMHEFLAVLGWSVL